MNNDYLESAAVTSENEKIKKNKASFVSQKTPEMSFDNSGLAFRRDARVAQNLDTMLYKKIDLHHYVEKMRIEANKEIFDFFEGIDPTTDSKNLKLLYFYFVGSRNLLNEMATEALNIY